MKIKEVQRLMDKIKGCDQFIGNALATPPKTSAGLQQCLFDAVRERRKCLIRQLSDAGLRVDEEV